MIAFRVDSSTQIGSGHLMRCLTLANKLKKNNDIIFICRNLENNLSNLVLEKGYRLFLLQNSIKNSNLVGYEKWLTVTQEEDSMQTLAVIKEKIDLLVVDCYAIDAVWEMKLRPKTKKIMVIDDLANRKHDCDILLDQNYYRDMNIRYDGLVSSKCKLLLGPQYALLREEFYEVKKKCRKRDGRIKNILVFFGGSDLTNETMKALLALEQIERSNVMVNVVVGTSNKNKTSIENYCRSKQNINFYCQVNNMADLMNEADLAIGAGGTTTWERCFLGLPAIVIAVAENQIQISKDCAELGVIEYIGEFFIVTIDKLKDVIQKILINASFCNMMTKNCLNLFIK